MSEFGADHELISAEFLRYSREYLAQGRLLQASEKGWGAAAHAAKLISVERNWSYRTHREFHSVIIPRLAAATGQSIVHRWGDSANELHRNFYNDKLIASEIADYLDDITDFVNLVRQTVGLPPLAI